jgi:hypothetical protein
VAPAFEARHSSKGGGGSGEKVDDEKTHATEVRGEEADGETGRGEKSCREAIDLGTRSAARRISREA